MFGETKTSGSLIGFLREATWTLRGIASVVILSFGGLVTAPAVAAVKQEVSQIQWHKQEEGPGAKLSGELQAVRDRLAGVGRKGLKGADLADMRKSFRADSAALADLDKDTLASFDATRAMIKDKHLPDMIMQRELAAEKQYKTEMGALRQGLDSITNESDDAKTQAKTKEVLDRLSKFQMERVPQKFDPKNLPNRSLKPDLSRVPHTTKKEFAEAGFISNPYLKVASISPSFDYSQLPGASDPGYLAATTEVTLSDAIKAKAAELHNNPVEIYNWVRNNVQWQPTWGAVQNADLTLSAQNGNAFDISSLLIALLRASGIPARYVHGTINVPEAKFRNWMGGFQNINAAVNYASAGGIPVKSLIGGGKIVTVQMEHIWVEAAIDYIPSRGSVNKSADTWIPMDASFKQYTFKRGIGPVAILGIDVNATTNSYLASGTVNSQAGYISGLDSSIMQNAANSVQLSTQNYVSQNLPNATVEDILGGRDIIPAATAMLSAGFANPIVVIGARYGSLPGALEQHMSFSLGEDAEGNPLNPATFAWTALNNQQVTLSFEPTTVADRQALESLLPSGDMTDASQFPDTIPAYLINVTPTLRLNGQVVLTGDSMTLGQDLIFVFTPEFVGRQQIPNTYDVIAGSYLDASVIAGNISPQIVRTVASRMKQTEAILESQDPAQLQTLTHEELVGDLFQAGLLDYYAQYSNLAYAAGLQQHSYFYLAGGVGTYGYEPHVDYAFGVPKDIRSGSAVMNVPIINAIGSDSQDKNDFLKYAFQIGTMSSQLEATVPEQMFHDGTTSLEAASAVSVLGLANSQGQKIYSLTQANAASLPQINISDSARDEISSALVNGQTVVVNESPVNVNGWVGSGYMMLDLQSGAGAYKISGGVNGGSLNLSVPDWAKEIFWGTIGEIGHGIGKGIEKIKDFIDFTKTLIQLFDDCSSDQANRAALSLGLIILGFESMAPAFAALSLAFPIIGLIAAILFAALELITISLVSEGWLKSCKQ